MNRWIRSALLAFLVAATAQYALIEVCLAASAQPVAKALTSVPTIASFVSALMWFAGSKWKSHGVRMLASSIVFFAVGLASYRAELPYGLAGVSSGIMAYLASDMWKLMKNESTLPVALTNYPREEIIRDEREAESRISQLTAMPHSYTFTKVGGSLLRQLREQAEQGKLAVVLHRSKSGLPCARVGSYEPVEPLRAEEIRGMGWDACLACFGLDVRSLSPYTMPTSIALPGGPEVTIPAGLAHGKWAIICPEPSSSEAKAVAEALRRSGWKVESPHLGPLPKVSQLLDRRRSPAASVGIGTFRLGRFDMTVKLCRPSSLMDELDLTGILLPPSSTSVEHLIPENFKVVFPNPVPLMMVGKGRVLEWSGDTWT